MKLFVSLDVRLAKTTVCMLIEHGKIVRKVDVAGDPKALVMLLGGLNGTADAFGPEMGPASQWLHRAMTDAGLPAVLVKTRQLKGVLKAMPIETDRRDAAGIGRMLHPGGFRAVHRKLVSAQSSPLASPIRTA